VRWTALQRDFLLNTSWDEVIDGVFFERSRRQALFAAASPNRSSTMRTIFLCTLSTVSFAFT